MDILQGLLLSFIPLFVAMDAIGTLPFLLSMTGHMSAPQRAKTVRYALLTALALGLGFIAVGKAVFWLLGISAADFLVAGGLILLALSISLLIRGRMVDVDTAAARETVGVVPLGTPLIVGPAVLTTLLLLSGEYSALIVLGAFIVNMAIAWLIFAQANRIARFLGASGMDALSKIMSLLLAAIAIKMVREGVVGMMEALGVE